MVEGAPKMQNVVDNHKNVLYNEKKIIHKTLQNYRNVVLSELCDIVNISKNVLALHCMSVLLR